MRVLSREQFLALLKLDEPNHDGSVENISVEENIKTLLFCPPHPNGAPKR